MSEEMSPDPTGGGARGDISPGQAPNLITQNDPSQGTRAVESQMRVGEDSREYNKLQGDSQIQQDKEVREGDSPQESTQETFAENKNPEARLELQEKKKVAFMDNPYKTGEAFKREKEKAEQRKLSNVAENKGSVYFSVRFSISGAHTEGETYTNDIGVVKTVLKAILAKAKTIDEDAFISPWMEELSPLKNFEDLNDLRKDSMYEYLFTPRVKKGMAYVRKDIKRGFNTAYSIRIQTPSLNSESSRKEAETFAAKWNRDAEGVVNFYHHKEIVGEKAIEVSVRDLGFRPIQGRYMKEIGYIHGSVRGMEMDEIVEHFQRVVNQQFQVKISSEWTQPEIGGNAAKMWQRANKYEGKERMGWAPLIQVIYAEEENPSKLLKMAMALHKAYGQYEEVKITTKKGTEYSEYVMNKLPDGSRGIFFPAYEVQRTNEGKKNVIEFMEMHVQLKQENSSWILTDIQDPDMFFEHEGRMVTIREFLLDIQAAQAVFMFHNMTTYSNPYLPGEVKVYLICNNQYRQGAAQKYREKMDWLLTTYPELKAAMYDDVSIGEISAFTLSTRHPNVPSRSQKDEEVQLDIVLDRERKRLSNVVIEGKRIKEDRSGYKPTMFESRPARIMHIQRDDDAVSVLSESSNETDPNTISTTPRQDESQRNDVVVRNTAIDPDGFQRVSNKRSRVVRNTTNIHNSTIGTMQVGDTTNIRQE